MFVFIMGYTVLTGFPGGIVIKNLHANTRDTRETRGRSLCWEDALKQ